jgi:hypothetical protein
MDRLFWRGRWEAVPEGDYVAAQRALLADDSWIIEGYIDPALADRARAADLIVYLDVSGARCAWRVLKRWWRHRRVARPELPPEALERLSPRFLWVVLTRAERPAIEASLAGVDASKIRRVRTSRALRRLAESRLSASP